jgi:hypothetical protein
MRHERLNVPLAEQDQQILVKMGHWKNVQTQRWDTAQSDLLLPSNKKIPFTMVVGHRCDVRETPLFKLGQRWPNPALLPRELLSGNVRFQVHGSA